ncbi:MAG TPA: 3-hydroxyacyl-CoA dehydrogenase family protein, partial [Mycobacterium sp.]|nr:3-hydroxyacyl-CoA dehydrogenase family protein [Mycobacterium sp.]
ITMDSEVPGFIANRLQEALWREALHMVAAGEATIEQIDRAVTDGPGLRWAFHGPFTTFHLAGGHGGIAHALEHFDPTEYSQWSRLASPELSMTLKQHLLDGAIATTDGRDVADLTSERDASIAAILRTLRRAEQPS